VNKAFEKIPPATPVMGRRWTASVAWSSPCLVLQGDADMFFVGQPQQIYDALQVPTKIVRFGVEDGAENHCQSGELSYKDQVVFDWLDETLGLYDGRKS
jgi:hypothetical protein